MPLALPVEVHDDRLGTNLVGGHLVREALLASQGLGRSMLIVGDDS